MVQWMVCEQIIKQQHVNKLEVHPHLKRIIGQEGQSKSRISVYSLFHDSRLLIYVHLGPARSSLEGSVLVERCAPFRYATKHEAGLPRSTPD